MIEVLLITTGLGLQLAFAIGFIVILREIFYAVKGRSMD